MKLEQKKMAGVLIAFFIAATVAAQPGPVQIGMAKSFLEDKPKSYIDIATSDFNKVLKEVSGLDGKVDLDSPAFKLAEKLDKKQVDFAIFYAHEFGWVQQKHPDLLPLLIAKNKHHQQRVHIVVHKKSGIKSFADLRGKKLDLPMGAGEPCRLFLAKLSGDKAPKDFFAAIQKSETQAEALDEVAREKVQVAVVDAFALEFYKEIKAPTYEKNLRVLQESEVFPPAVLVYKKGGVDEKVLTSFRDGLLKAHTVDLGRDMMKAWNIDAFEPIPKDYGQRVAEIVKSYPPPR